MVYFGSKRNKTCHIFSLMESQIKFFETTKHSYLTKYFSEVVDIIFFFFFLIISNSKIK